MSVFIDRLTINRMQAVQPHQPLIFIPNSSIEATYAANIKPTQQASESIVIQFK
jgi:hypothetical protein